MIEAIVEDAPAKGKMFQRLHELIDSLYEYEPVRETTAMDVAA